MTCAAGDAYSQARNARAAAAPQMMRRGVFALPINMPINIGGQQLGAGGGGQFKIVLNIGANSIERTSTIDGTATRIAEGAIPE
jgi:hypothetical protein